MLKSRPVLAILLFVDLNSATQAGAIQFAVKMSLPPSYYIKNLFASSYGKDRPSFFIWYPKGTPSSEKKYALTHPS